MTGYGRGLWQGDGVQIQVELRSVNSRYLNIKFRLPEGFLRFENVLETLIKKKLKRGSVSCQIQFKKEDSQSDFNTDKLLDLYKKLEKLSQVNNLKSEISLSQLALLPELNNSSSDFLDDDSIQKFEEGIAAAMKQALEGINDMRQKEGEELKKQILLFTQELEEFSEKVAEKAPSLSGIQQERFIERLKKLQDDIEVSEADLSRELAVLADRSDISEEVTRLFSHLIQLKEVLDQGGLVGRKLDFVLQEVNREINTVGSKSSDADLSKIVVDMKSVAEKIREQVQNIE
jgi:uncharacterized protein (TIGR00255 family)